MKCNICNNDFDPGCLNEVYNHMHTGKRAIRHAREVYEHCSADFASGVHMFLRGEKHPEYPESKETIQGYYSAERDCQNIILITSIGAKTINN